MKAVQIPVQTPLLQIGARLRAARQRQNLTIDQVAAITALNKGFISRIERDMTSPSVTTLMAICDALSLPIGELFAAPEADMVRADEAPTIWLCGEGTDERLLTPRSQPRLQLIRSVVEPGGNGGDELYTLNSEVQVVHVLAGQLDVIFIKRLEHLRKGDTLTFSGREPHNWKNPSKTKSAELMWVVAPASWDTRQSS